MFELDDDRAGRDHRTGQLAGRRPAADAADQKRGECKSHQIELADRAARILFSLDSAEGSPPIFISKDLPPNTALQKSQRSPGLAETTNARRLDRFERHYSPPSIVTRGAHRLPCVVEHSF